MVAATATAGRAQILSQNRSRRDNRTPKPGWAGPRKRQLTNNNECSQLIFPLQLGKPKQWHAKSCFGARGEFARNSRSLQESVSSFAQVRGLAEICVARRRRRRLNIGVGTVRITKFGPGSITQGASFMKERNPLTILVAKLSKMWEEQMSSSIGENLNVRQKRGILWLSFSQGRTLFADHCSVPFFMLVLAAQSSRYSIRDR